MGAATDPPSITGSASTGCRSTLLLHLNPLLLYDPRSPCAQGAFLWGILYPIAVAFLIYTGVMVAVLVLAALLRREPSTLIDQVGFAQVVSVLLTGARLVLSALIIVRRTKDLGWSWLVALFWLAIAIVSLQSLGPVLGWLAGAAQVIVLLVLMALPGKTARARKAVPG
jgi:uncharacterized membrane protein YhaH (DUF805 family)